MKAVSPSKSSKKSHSTIPKINRSTKFRSYKKDIEEVLKLNLNDPIIFKSQSKGKVKIQSQNTIDPITVNNIEEINEGDYGKSLMILSSSIKKLRLVYPNISGHLGIEKFTNGPPTREEHVKFEEYLKKEISIYNREEQEIIDKMTSIEKDIQELEEKVLDKQLNIEILNDKEGNRNKLGKLFLQQYLELQEKKGENEYHKGERNPSKKMSFVKDLQTSKDFQDQLNLFLLREDYDASQKSKVFEGEIDDCKKDRKTLIEHLSKIKIKHGEIRYKKKIATDKLYTHYLNLLKEGKDTRNEGLAWIIREIFTLGRKVMLSFLPEYLDKQCIKYLFDVTHLNMKITEMEKIVKEKKNEVIEEGNIKVQKSEGSFDYLRERNNATMKNLRKLKETFCTTCNTNSKNEKLANEAKMNPSVSKIIGIIKKVNLPYVGMGMSGDPNEMTGSKDKISLNNKMIKDEVMTYSEIPNVIKLRDFEKMVNSSGYFLKSEQITKLNDYFSATDKLTKLRKEKDNLKLNEMNRIFKEFQRNNYESRFSVDKPTVIKCLIGEENLSAEMVKQQRREKKYMEEISKSRMHKKINIIRDLPFIYNSKGVIAATLGLEAPGRKNNMVEANKTNKSFRNPCALSTGELNGLKEQRTLTFYK